MVTFAVGSLSIKRIWEMNDHTFNLRSFFPLSTDEAVLKHLDWMVPTHFNPHNGNIALSMHSWLIDTGSEKILVDTCVGNDKVRPGRDQWTGLRTQFLERLTQTGVHPADIDYVLCTHLHADHVGWNTKLVDGSWIPTFPNAKYVFSQREYEFWTEQTSKGEGGPHLTAYQDSVLPVIAAGQGLIIDDGYQIGNCITLRSAPGHTPGHVAVWIDTPAGRAVLTGDIVHHPIQIYYPTWSCIGCLSPDLASATRFRVLEECAESGAVLVPAHFMAPHVGTVLHSGEAFAFRFRCENAG